MDELIKKIIEYKDDLRTLYPSSIVSNHNEFIRIGVFNFCKRGGTCYLPRSYYGYFNYNVNNVLWSNEGWMMRYGLGYTNTLYPLTNKNYDAISFSFSGCTMVRFVLQNKYHYIAHIHSSTNFNEDMRSDFINFFNNNKDNISIKAMFRPDCDDGDMIKIPGLQLWGVITKELNCYSVYVKCHMADNSLTEPYDPKCIIMKLHKIKLLKNENRLPISIFLDETRQGVWTAHNMAEKIRIWNGYFTGVTQEIYNRDYIK